LSDRIAAGWPLLLAATYGALVLAYAVQSTHRVLLPGLAVAMVMTSLVVVGLLAAAMQVTKRDIAQLASRAGAAPAQRGTAPLSAGWPTDAEKLAAIAATIDALTLENTRLSHAVRQISGNIAHELARPIVDILRYIDNGACDCRSCQPIIDEIYDKVTNIHEMYLRILDITRISEVSKFNLTPVDLAEILNEAVNFCGEDITEKSILVDISASSAPVMGEYWLLTSAVGNVIANAVRFSPHGARLIVTTGRDGTVPYVQVEDAGPGVPDIDLPALLARLKRDSEGERKMDHGFGLRLVQATAAMHGASIVLSRSRLGGLALRIAFPNAVPSSSQDSAP
jgi:signal transduction histidine kinase